MIDFSRLENYRENNRIEAKKSLGGFPHSFWETYSAFANTMGGIILLGVEELKDHSLHAVNLPDPEKLLTELWRTLNDPAKVSVNILTNKHAKVETIDGKRIIAVTVPRAKRYDKPVYIGGNALGGTYRRNGEGDYRCSPEEIDAMLRDASAKTPDMRVLENFGLDALNPDSIKAYRARMKICRPKHVWEKLSDDLFLIKTGAACADGGGKLHPTCAGLLMFGRHAEILKEYPRFSLSYCGTDEKNSTEKVNWCGNILDFYDFASKKLSDKAVVPPEVANGGKIDVSPVSKAIAEALANCILNADYHAENSVEITHGNGVYSFTNAGSFRIDAGLARAGGISDPRNGALTKIFNLIDVGAGMGNGLPQIYALWERQGWLTPSLYESFNPDRVTFTLTVGGKSDGHGVVGKADTTALKALIIVYLTDHAFGTAGEICAQLGLPADRTESALKGLITSDLITCDANGAYRLKR